jgi:hypothetical protein
MMRKHPLLAFVLVASTSTLACSGGSGSGGSSGTSRDTPADVTFGNPALSVCSNGSSNNQVSTADFNGDGLPDLLGCAAGDPQAGTYTSVIAFLNLGGTFDAGHTVSLPNGFSFPGAIDINGDGKADIVAVDMDGTAHIIFSNGDGTFGQGIVQPDFPSGTCIIDQYSLDGYADAICLTDTTLSVLHMASDGSTLPGFTMTVPSFPSIVDINGDGKLDFVFRLGSNIAAQLGDGGSSFGSLQVVVTSDSPLGNVSFADIDGDGLDDMMVTSGSDDTGWSATLLHNEGSLTFTTWNQFAEASGIYYDFKEVTGDGYADIVLAQNTQNLVMVGNGDGSFADDPVPVMGPWTSGVSFIDLNNDGKPDVVGGVPSVVATMLRQ